MNKQLTLIAVWLFMAMGMSAQSYWQERMDTVSAPGYYHIELSQEMAGLGLHTLRILDGNDHEIPYLIRSSVPVKEMKQMEMYDLVANTSQDSINTIIVQNKEAEVSRFYVRMKEAEVVKYIGIRGSYDRKQWFSVKQRALLRTESNPVMGEIGLVDFPKGDYTYYELTITNSSNSPLNITGVGKIEASSIYGQLVELHPGRFVVEEEKNNTVITFPEMAYPYYLSKLELKVTGKGHYSRNLEIGKKNSFEGSFQLSSREERAFYVDHLLVDKELRLVIENQNNPPLTVDEVKLFGLSRYLCAYLDAGMQYRIVTSDERHRRYDIQDFADEIPLNLPVVKTGDIKEVVVEKEPEREPGFLEKPAFLWSVIVLVGILLLFICLKMLRELKKR